MYAQDTEIRSPILVCLRRPIISFADNAEIISSKYVFVVEAGVSAAPPEGLCVSFAVDAAAASSGCVKDGDDGGDTPWEGLLACRGESISILLLGFGLDFVVTGCGSWITRGR